MGKASPVFSSSTTTADVSGNFDESAPHKNDFVILCPSSAKDSGWQEAISALPFLPQNYKVVILSDTLGSELGSFAHDRAILDRIQFKKQTEMSDEASPFVFADAVVYGDADEVISTPTPRVVVSKSVDSYLKNNDRNEFIVSADSPEAFASAVLRIKAICA